MGAEPHRGVAHVLQAKHYLPTEIRLFQFGTHDNIHVRYRVIFCY